MKRGLITMALLIICKISVAQLITFDPNNMLQGIVNSVNQIAETSKTVVGIYKGVEEANKIYEQSKWYYDKLASVNNLIKDGKRVAECVNFVNEMVEIYTTNMSKFVIDKNITPEELANYTKAYNIFLKRSSKSIGELSTVISRTSLTMSDKERMDLIRGVHKELAQLNYASKSLTWRIHSMSKYRADQKRQAAQITEFFK